jgi:hypothetical protein
MAMAAPKLIAQIERMAQAKIAAAADREPGAVLINPESRDSGFDAVASPRNDDEAGDVSRW